VTKSTFSLFSLILVCSVGLSVWLWQPGRAQALSGITFPGANSSVAGEVIIRGTATTGSFQRYELSYKPVNADDDAYILFAGRNEEVFDGALGEWDTNLIQPGPYALRLRVVKLDGNYLDYVTAPVHVRLPAPPTTHAPSVASPARPVGTQGSSLPASVPSVGGAFSALGYGVASAPATRVDVRLYLRRGSGIFFNPADLSQVADILNSLGNVSEISQIAFSRTPAGDLAGEVRFLYAQPTNLSQLLRDVQGRIPDGDLRIVDVAPLFLPSDCPSLEQSAFQQALTQAGRRANALALAQSALLGPLVGVSEVSTSDGRSGGCGGLGQGSLVNSPESVEIGVVLLASYARQSGSPNTQPTPTPAPAPETETNDPTSPVPTPEP
jgi:hypothetical protein